jgi:hypothetical protein
VSQTTITKRSALPGVAREKLCRCHTEAVVGRLGLAVQNSRMSGAFGIQVGRRVEAVEGRKEGERIQRQRAVRGRTARVHVSPWSCRLWCDNINDDGINLVRGVEELI